MTAALVAASGSKWMWYLTRGSGAVTLVLLTLSLCLGIVGMFRLPKRFPRFAVADLHRNLTLLAVVFLGVHIATSVADTYAPIGLKDAVVPFTSAYRPFWLGLGALSFDLMLALVVTSLLRVRLGLRTWRAVHWLAYACWPLALFHSLGTGSDPRATWLQALAAGGVVLVLAAVCVRLARSRFEPGIRVAAGGAVFVALLLSLLWFETGPAAKGWAAKAGTPPSLLKHGGIVRTVTTTTTAAAMLPAKFVASLKGTATEGTDANGLVDVHLDGALRGGLRGELKLVLQGVPLDDGGVSMTASGVSFAAAGTSLYQGQIVGLQGNLVTARVSDGSGHTLELSLVLQLARGSNALSGTLRGSVV
jgi:methionine sulfoxide reductase heme-binding subunit